AELNESSLWTRLIQVACLATPDSASIPKHPRMESTHSHGLVRHISENGSPDASHASHTSHVSYA
ncbi:MAG: hypothetical protein ABF581_03505, partial [Bifidobacterium sp.]